MIPIKKFLTSRRSGKNENDYVRLEMMKGLFCN